MLKLLIIDLSAGLDLQELRALADGDGCKRGSFSTY